MKTLILILSAAALLNLSCAQPQKFEANIAVVNTNNNQPNSDIPTAPADAPIFIISEDGKVFLQKKDKKELLGTTSETENFANHSTVYLK